VARYITIRLLIAFAVAITVSLVSFALLRLSGDLARVLAGEGATPEDVARVAKLYGLDRPFFVQYLDWLLGVMHGDMGTSLFTNQPVLNMLLDTVGVTIRLAVLSLLFGLAIAVPLGVYAAVYANTWIDRVALALAVFGKAVPNFWLALILIYYFGVQLRWLPISGMGSWTNYIMPVVTMGVGVMPQLMRLTRSGMMDVLEADYVRTAWAKGLSPRRVFFKHALRNAILPVVAVSAVSLGFMLGGSVIVETIFSINGIGALAYRSIRRVDFPVVQSILFFLSFAYILLTLIADLINAQLDPRIRLA
jgi:ABC-type dipeptide/oligopeptide/nickel transport system permease component